MTYVPTGLAAGSESVAADGRKLTSLLATGHRDDADWARAALAPPAHALACRHAAVTAFVARRRGPTRTRSRRRPCTPHHRASSAAALSHLCPRVLAAAAGTATSPTCCGSTRRGRGSTSRAAATPTSCRRARRDRRCTTRRRTRCARARADPTGRDLPECLRPGDSAFGRCMRSARAAPSAARGWWGCPTTGAHAHLPRARSLAGTSVGAERRPPPAGSTRALR